MTEEGSGCVRVCVCEYVCVCSHSFPELGSLTSSVVPSITRQFFCFVLFYSLYVSNYDVVYRRDVFLCRTPSDGRPSVLSPS